MNRAGAAALFAAIAMLVSGCVIGGPEVSSRASCDGPAFTSDEMPKAAPRTLILVELSRNDEDAREAVVEAIDPVVVAAVAEGGVVRLLVGGGEGEPVSESPCLDGSSAIFVDRNNDETERRARAGAVDAIEGDVSALLEEAEVAPMGDLSNLLAAAPGELRSLETTEGTRPDADASVLVVSDLTSRAPAGDCLDLEGVHAEQAVADALIRRCFEAGQLQRLPEGVSLRIVRPQLTPSDNDGTRLAGYLGTSLCRQWTYEGGGCAEAPAGRG